jgi:hypothetical protein
VCVVTSGVTPSRMMASLNQIRAHFEPSSKWKGLVLPRLVGSVSIAVFMYIVQLIRKVTVLRRENKILLTRKAILRRRLQNNVVARGDRISVFQKKVIIFHSMTICH